MKWRFMSTQFVLFKGAKQTQTEKLIYLLYKLCVYFQSSLNMF